MTTTLVITGSRDWTDEQTILAWLDRFKRDTFVIHGAARGADLMAGEAAKSLGMRVVKMPVNERVDGPWPAAGCRRNTRMLRAALECTWRDAQSNRPSGLRVLAFVKPSVPTKRSKAISSGTLDCVEQALLMGIAVTCVPEGGRP